jgi:hypothetical protein
MAKSGGMKGKPGMMPAPKPASVNKPPAGGKGGGKPAGKGKGC